MNRSAAQALREVPFAVTQPDRIPKQRYYDREFYDLEVARLWPRVWQMACRLEEIRRPGDYIVYENVGQSIIVTRIDAHTIKAYHNACRHRGAQLVKDRGRRPGGFICPYHGWQWNLGGENTFVYSPELFNPCHLGKDDLRLREVRCEIWGGCAFINLDESAPSLRKSITHFADMHDAWQVEDLKVEWWMAARIPCNWKLAMEAFQEGYHVMQTHPQLIPPGAGGTNAAFLRQGKEFPMARYWTSYATPPAVTMTGEMFYEGSLAGMKMLSAGMQGMTHAKDVAIAESLRGIELPDDPVAAGEKWFRALNDAVVDRNREQGMAMPDLNDIMDQDMLNAVNFCFPHFFLLPTLSSAASYRVRPLGPEETLFEIWSLTRFPDDEERPPLQTPTPIACDDESWPAIPTQDFSNLPGQQKGLHTGGIDALILSREVEGLISNNHRTIDGFLAGLDHATLLPAVQKASGLIDTPILDLGLGN